jgi:hypothetical protein
MSRNLLISLLLFAATASYAEVDWKKSMLEDVVKFEGDKMVMTDYFLVKTQDEQGNPKSLQFKIHAESPARGVLSRDCFIVTCVGLYLPIMLTIGETTSIEEPIGNVDVEYNLFMSAKGLQIEVLDNTNGTKNRNTMTWEEIYEPNK